LQSSKMQTYYTFSKSWYNNKTIDKIILMKFYGY
jgi:hypothetical protein